MYCVYLLLTQRKLIHDCPTLDPITHSVVDYQFRVYKIRIIFLKGPYLKELSRAHDFGCGVPI